MWNNFLSIQGPCQSLFFKGYFEELPTGTIPDLRRQHYTSHWMSVIKKLIKNINEEIGYYNI